VRIILCYVPIMPAFPKPIHYAQQVLKNCIQKGDVVVDATLGNGHDALFLADLVGKSGHVFGFDVQEQAIFSSKERMEQSGVNHITFYHLGHEKMEEVIPSSYFPITAVMFNLGYLPNADKSVITRVETTLCALDASQSLLKVGGVISLMCYPGHDGGDQEAEAVSEWAAKLSRRDYRVVKYALQNAPNNPPFLILIEKLG